MACTASRSAASKRGSAASRQAQPRRHGVAAETLDQAWMRGVDPRQHVADVQSGNGSRGAAQAIAPRLSGRERHGGPVMALLEFRRDQADHARMPLRHRTGTAPTALRHRPASTPASSASASSVICCWTARRSLLIWLSVDAMSRAWPRSSLSRHSMPSAMSSSRPAALIRGASPKPMSAADSDGRSRPATSASARNPAQPCPARRRRRPAATSARLFASRGTRSATVPTATRSSSARQIGFGARQRPRFTQAAAQREQHVEDHAHAREHLAGERIAGLVRIDDRIGGRQRRTGEMMVGDEHLPSARLCRGDAGMARDAVVDGHQQVRLQRGEILDQSRRQSVAVHDAVGHRMRHASCAEHAQSAHADGAGGRAVAIEIADDHDVPVGRDRRGEQCRRGLQPTEGIRRQQLRQLRLRLVDAVCAAHRVDATQQRRHVRGPVA